MTSKRRKGRTLRAWCVFNYERPLTVAWKRKDAIAATCNRQVWLRYRKRGSLTVKRVTITVETD